MPVHVRWENEAKTITRLDFEGAIRMGEVFDAWREELALMNSVHHHVYSLNIFDRVNMVIDGPNISKIRIFIQQNQPNNLYMTIQVAKNKFVFRLLKTIANLMSHEVHVVCTIEEAYAIIDNHRKNTRLTA